MGGINNRESERKDTLNLVDYVVLDENGRETDRAMARTMNISEKGILLETYRPLAKGQQLMITVSLRNELFEFRGRVVHSETCADEFHCNGIEFLDISQEGMTLLRNFLKAFKNQQDSP
jgi:hypothetical protein